MTNCIMCGVSKEDKYLFFAGMVKGIKLYQCKSCILDNGWYKIITCTTCGEKCDIGTCGITEDQTGARQYYCTTCYNNLLDNLTGWDTCEVCGQPATVNSDGIECCTPCSQSYALCIVPDCTNITRHFEQSHMYVSEGV